MRKDDVRQLLWSVRDLTSKTNLAYDRWQRLKATAEAVTAKYLSAPGGSKGDQRKDAVWATAAEAHERFREAYNAAAIREREVNELISALPSRDHREILHYRYLAGLSWPDVFQMLEHDGIFYSERQVFNLHGDALNELRRIYHERREHDEDRHGEDTHE